MKLSNVINFLLTLYNSIRNKAIEYYIHSLAVNRAEQESGKLITIHNFKGEP